MINAAYIIGILATISGFLIAWMLKRGVTALDKIQEKQEATNLHLVRLNGRIGNVETNFEKHEDEDTKQFGVLFDFKNSQSP